jgi:2-amino-4-hydroxy-6-hydroxymethyldihydropteridine diphosphokinase
MVFSPDEINGFIGLGSNLGDRLDNLKKALTLLQGYSLQLRTYSDIYQTEAKEVTYQPDFLNMVIGLQTNLLPLELLEICLEIEQKMGRIRSIPKGPRTIDLDLLLMNDLIMNCPKLVLPHPRLHLRRFVLVPLHEVASERNHPVLKKTIHSLMEEAVDFSRVEWYCDARRISPIISVF